MNKEEKAKASVNLLNATQIMVCATQAVLDRDIDMGIVKPDELRFTIEARKRTVLKLVSGGMSQRQAAKATGTSHTQVQRDLGVAQKVPKSGTESAKTQSYTRAQMKEITAKAQVGNALSLAAKYCELAAVLNSDAAVKSLASAVRENQERFSRQQHYTISQLAKACEKLLNATPVFLWELEEGK